MSVCRKLPDGTVQKIAGHTILLDANASEVRQGTITIDIQDTTTNQYSGTVTFSDPMPDTDYAVVLNVASWNEDGNIFGTPWRIISKTTTGFTITGWKANTSQTTQIAFEYFAWKPVKIDGYTALQNKVNNPDETPTKDSMNLVTSGGVYEAIKNASAVWKGTKAEWNALPAAEKQTYDLAVLLDTTLVKAVDREDGTETDVANLNKIWRGTKAEWEALSVTEKAKYDQAEVIDEYTGVPVVVDKIEAGNLNPVTSNAVYDALAPIGTHAHGHFSPYSTTGQHDSNLALTEGTWLVIVTMLTGPTTSGNMYMTAGGTKVSGFVRADGTNERSIALNAIVTVGVGDTKVIGFYQRDGGSSSNGDPNYWYVDAYRLK